MKYTDEEVKDIFNRNIEFLLNNSGFFLPKDITIIRESLLKYKICKKHHKRIFPSIGWYGVKYECSYDEEPNTIHKI